MSVRSRVGKGHNSDDDEYSADLADSNGEVFWKGVRLYVTSDLH